MRITGTLHSIGEHHLADGPGYYNPETGDDTNIKTINGVFITADEDTLRAASNLLYCTVDIYPHPVNELIAGECTPENYAHAMARLAHAESPSPTADHLAREVRSSQALIENLATLEAQHAALLAKQAEQERLLSIYRTKYHEADRALQQAHADLAALQAEARAVKDDDASAGD